MAIKNDTTFTVGLTPSNIWNKKSVSLKQGNDIVIHKKDGTVIFGKMLDAEYSIPYESDTIVFDRNIEIDKGYEGEKITDKLVLVSDIEKISDQSEDIVAAHLSEMMSKLKNIEIDNMSNITLIKIFDLAILLCKGEYRRAWARFDAIISNQKMKVNISGNNCEITYEE